MPEPNQQAMWNAFIQSERDKRRWLAGRRAVLPQANTRAALMRELERAYVAGFDAGRAHDARLSECCAEPGDMERMSGVTSLMRGVRT